MTGHERSLAEPQFPGDDGTADERLIDADPVGLLRALRDARVFVPIVPVLGERTTDQHRTVLSGTDRTVPSGTDQTVPSGTDQTVPSGTDKNADMAAVLMTGADGRTALLAFTSTAALERWNPQARPVPVLGADAARACLDEGATAILLDLPDLTVVETDDVEHLAAGHRLIDTPDGPAWVQ